MGKPESSILCPKCFTFNVEETDFCNKCGSALEEKEETLSIHSKDPAFDDIFHFSPGDHFGKRYRIVEEIGRGGMGRVYKAEDLELNITVALKIISPKYSKNPRFIERFKKEVLSARSISHENVIRIFDLGEEEGIKYFSMEYIKGQNLRDFIRSSGFPTIKRSVEIMRQVCFALNAAHKHGIIHRDLKPSNIMIDNSGQAYVMDFGLARSLSGLESEKPKAIEGTPRYMSPEQIEKEKLDHRTDIYSLGLVFYELLAGQPAFDADSSSDMFEKQVKELPRLPSEINPHVSPALNKIITKCLKKNKSDRYSHVDDILKDLTQATATSQTYGRPIKRRKYLRFLYAAAAVAAVVAGIFIVKYTQRLRTTSPRIDKRISVAVVNFENLTGDSTLDHLSRIFSVLITQDLLQSTLIRPVTPSHLYEIHDRLGLAGETHYTTDDLKRFADLGNVENILWGSFSKEGDTLRVDAFLYETGSMETIGSAISVGEQPSTMVDSLTPNIKSAFGLPEAAIAQDIDLRITDITTDSPLALAHYLEGTRLYDERKFEESNSRLLKAVELDPSFVMAYRKISINYGYMRDTPNEKIFIDKAMSHLDKASEREKYLILGLRAQLFGESAEAAEKYYLALLDLYPDDIVGNTQLGSLYRNLEEWDKALLRFEKVLEIDKHNMIALHNQGAIFKAKGFYTESLNLLTANQDAYTQAMYHRDLSRLYYCQGETELALEEVEKFHSTSPDDSDYCYLKGMIHQARDEFSEAEKEFEKLRQSEVQEEQLRARLWLARLYLNQGRMEKGRNTVNRGLKSAREFNLPSYEADLLLMSAFLDYRTQELKTALNTSENAFTIATEIAYNGTARFALLIKGLCHLEMNDQSKAEETAAELRQMIEDSGSHNFIRIYHLLMGNIALKNSEYSQAVDYFEMAANALSHQRTTAENHVLFFDALAQAAEAKGDIRKAQAQYEKITLLTSGRMAWGDLYALSFYRLGKIYQERGMKEEALGHFEKYLELWEQADTGTAERQDAQNQINNLKN